MARTVDPERHRQRRDAITRAAASLFAQRGFARTTTSLIAKEAGISPGSLFYYFTDKDAIFRAIFESDIPKYRELFATQAESDDPLAALFDVVDTLAAPAREREAPGLLVELLRRVDQDPELAEVVGTGETIVQDGLAELLRRAVERGSIDYGLDERRTAAWIRTIVDATYLNSDTETETDPLPMLRFIIARFIGAGDRELPPNTGKELR